MVPSRHNMKWRDDEVENLYREYDLLEMSIEEISNIHQRTSFSILHKLQKEGIIDRWENARGWKVCIKDFQTYVKYDYEYDSDEKTTSSEEDDIKEEVVSVEFLPEEKEKEKEKEKDDDTYNLEVNSVRTAVIHFFCFIVYSIEYITSFFPKRRFNF
jgi:hypothetical protein